MTDGAAPPADASWRLITRADMPFVYDLVTKVDPRWWRFSRYGLEPSRLLETARGIAAGVLVTDGFGKPVACALLADAGAAGTGTLDYFAFPDPEAQALARRFAPELIAAAFAGTPLQRLYYERFENDADVLGDVGKLFEIEVTYPDFAMVDGHYEARTTSVLVLENFATWQQAATE